MFSYKSFSMWWILFSDVFAEALLVRKINPDAISANDEKASWLPELWVPINHYSIKSTANFIFCTWMVSKKLFYNNSLIIRAKWFTICISAQTQEAKYSIRLAVKQQPIFHSGSGFFMALQKSLSCWTRNVIPILSLNKSLFNLKKYL